MALGWNMTLNLVGRIHSTTNNLRAFVLNMIFNPVVRIHSDTPSSCTTIVKGEVVQLMGGYVFVVFLT